MTPMETRLRELLSRAVFIPKLDYQKILDADALAQKEMLDLLESMDEIQINMFGRILDEEPWFFEACEQRVNTERCREMEVELGLRQSKSDDQ